jgi:hypothetical protein
MYSFEGLPPDSCPQCKARKDAQYQRVREIVKDNPGITALEVHAITEVPITTIAKYIEAGMLEVMSKQDSLDNGELQIWISRKAEKGKRLKDAAEKAKPGKNVEPPPEEMPEDAPPPRKGSQERIHWVIH